MQAVPTSGAIAPMADAIFAYDRGYNSAETIKLFNESLGATGLGTHKRSLDFPFKFGETRNAKRHKGMEVSEKGCRVVYSATKKPSSGGRRVQAALYRESVSGMIAAMYHNDEKLLGAHKFTLLPIQSFRGKRFDGAKLESIQVLYDRSDHTQPELAPSVNTAIRTRRSSRRRSNDELPVSNNSILINCVLNRTNQLTILQSEDPGWFLARAFLFTSRTSHTFIRAIASDFSEHLKGLSHILSGVRISVNSIPLSSQVEEAEEFLCYRFDLVLSYVNILKK